MFIDIRTLPDRSELEAEICIIGAGAAGITLARELSGETYRVALLESGDLDFDSDTQSLYEGTNIGIHYGGLDDVRLRYFGGTTNHWGGHCRPLLPIDFEKRDWVPDSGWPIRYQDLEPYYQRASSICELPGTHFETQAWLDEIGDPKLDLLPLDADRIETLVSQYSPPTRFGDVYREDLESSGNVTVYLNANVTEIETDENAVVTQLQIRTLDGKAIVAKAKIFVLATGGIENARLMLLSNATQPNGLGNQYNLVGRYFQEHPHLTSGQILFSRSDISVDLYDTGYTYHNSPVAGALSLTPNSQVDEQLLNYTCYITPIFQGEASEGAEAFKRLYHGAQDRTWPDNVWRDLGDIVTDLDDVANAIYGRMFRPQSAISLVSITNIFEQAPNPNSRVTLGTNKDMLNLPRVELDWQMTALDRRTVIRAQEMISENLGVAGLGRVKIELAADSEDWPSTLEWGWHHMGTTRMADNPKQGVVDSDCRVFGTPNLYIAGSSVFPTSGAAPPTLTIVALALRLNEHLKAVLRT